MTEGFLPYGRQVLDDDDIAAVVDVLNGDWLTTGPSVDAFDVAFAEAVSVPHAVSCSSGTAALHLAAMALGLGPGDHVVVPTVTFLATANAARYVGADVVFADVDPETGLTSASLIREAVDRSGKTPSAIFPVHLAGHTVDVAAIRAAFPDTPIVEDACHALGGQYLTSDGSSVPVGACPDSEMAVFSTHPVKTLATGEGGIVTTVNSELAAKLKTFRNHGMSRDPDSFRNADMAFEGGNRPNPWYYEMAEPGYNYRLSDIHAALGLSQLSKLVGFVDKRRTLRHHYAELLANRGPHLRAAPVAPNCDPAWHLMVALIDFDALGTSRARVMSELKERDIGTQVHYIPVHTQPYYRDIYGDTDLPGAQMYYEKCLSLPLYTMMENADVERVVDALGAVLDLN